MNSLPSSTNEEENKNKIEQTTLPLSFKERVTFFVKRTLKYVVEIIASFSHIERSVFFVFAVIFLVSSIGVLFNIHSLFLVEVPVRGGEFKEGVVGTAPRFINPLLAISDSDRDLTQLVYSGLMRANPEGELTLDLAEKYTVSPDGLVYTFTLKTGLTWHDGEHLTSDDVVFTVEKAKDSTLKSPRRASWEGVSVEKLDERTVQFTLKQAYSPFVENTTLGILPSHIWKDINAEQFGFSKFNIEPIGSGPYEIRDIKKDSDGIPKQYALASFRGFALGRPYIDKVEIKFYQNEDDLIHALQTNDVQAVNALRAEKARELEEKGFRIEQYTLPRVFGVFFNQNQNTLFTNQTIREALALSIDKQKIINDVLFGYGAPLEGPLPPGPRGYARLPGFEEVATEGSSTAKIDQAIELLEKGGWKLDPESGIRVRKGAKETTEFRFTITTSDAEELKKAAEQIEATWEELGAEIELKIFNPSDLSQNIIRPRKYDALFFGEIIGRESDPFAFWHSSQRNDPGLNIALYANITVDKLLEEGRVNSDEEERTKLYANFEDEVKKDIPAVFVYSPDFIYVLPKTIQGVNAGLLTVPSERFIDIYNWFTETHKVWKIFAK